MSSEVNVAAYQIKYNIKSWENICDFYKELSLSIQTIEDEVKLVKLTSSSFFVEYFVYITNEFKVQAYQGSTLLGIRDLSDSVHGKFTLYSQLQKFIARVSKYPVNFISDIGHDGETDLDQRKR